MPSTIQVKNSVTGTMGKRAAKRSRYEKMEVAYGQIKVNANSPDILLGDTAEFTHLPSKELIEARFVTNASTPNKLSLFCGDSATDTPISWTVGKETTKIDYMISYIRGTGHAGDGNASDGVMGVRLALAVMPSAPAITHPVANTLGTTTATLTAGIQTNGAATTVTIDWGTTNACTTHTLVVPTTNGTIAAGTTTVVAVTLALTGLVTNTQYYYKVRATNAAGTTVSSVNFGNDAIFHTT